MYITSSGTITYTAATPFSAHDVTNPSCCLQSSLVSPYAVVVDLSELPLYHVLEPAYSICKLIVCILYLSLLLLY